MKASVKRIVAACAVLGVTGVAHAGQKYSFEVVVDTAEKEAAGAYGDTRNSSDSRQFIGCTAFLRSDFTYMHCEATDSNGVHAVCVSYDPRMLNMVLGIGTNSYIYFRWDDSGMCTQMEVAKYSIYAPAVP